MPEAWEFSLVSQKKNLVRFQFSGNHYLKIFNWEILIKHLMLICFDLKIINIARKKFQTMKPCEKAGSDTLSNSNITTLNL